MLHLPSKSLPSNFPTLLDHPCLAPLLTIASSSTSMLNKPGNSAPSIINQDIKVLKHVGLAATNVWAQRLLETKLRFKNHESSKVEVGKFDKW